jgi:hypothetical protein
MLLEELREYVKATTQVIEALNELIKKSPIPESQINSLINPKFLEQLNEMNVKFNHWKPNIYIYVEGGIVQEVISDCNIYLSIFDDDIESRSDEDDDDQTKNKESYQDRKETFKWMIESGLRDGTLKRAIE